ncbi:hypothetical protein [Sphingomonas sp. Leaf62]|uniref:hypothetical protein n=1 Tax=Sphingomonas sp. Leaf62 TaxID=1736228 RepID=UPI0006F37D53|nr:hypothetical protein [Sphingomonas sp. Leaf62]KQN77876.1 hypothetical protein ASE91_14255 [Sphingomonas sp. Leaf62]
MIGTDIIGTVLREAAPVTAMVPGKNIKTGRLPDIVKLPALLIRTISLIERQPLKRTGMVRWTERVAVTVRAENYLDQKLILRRVRAVCLARSGAIAGAERVSILPAGAGPDIAGPANSFEQTHDFRVSFDAPEEAAGA